MENNFEFSNNNLDPSIQADGVYDLDHSCLNCNTDNSLSNNLKYYNYHHKTINYNHFFLLILFILIIN